MDDLSMRCQSLMEKKHLNDVMDGFKRNNNVNERREEVDSEEEEFAADGVELEDLSPAEPSDTHAHLTQCETTAGTPCPFYLKLSK